DSPASAPRGEHLVYSERGGDPMSASPGTRSKAARPQAARSARVLLPSQLCVQVRNRLVAATQRSPMDFFVSLEHRDELGDLARSRLPLLHGSYAIEDRIPVRTGQRCKEGCRLRALIQCCLEVGGHLGLTCGCVGGFPPAVCLGSLDLCQPARMRPSSLQKLGCAGAVYLRPLAARLARREADKPVFIVVLVEPPIDPAVAERSVA